MANNNRYSVAEPASERDGLLGDSAEERDGPPSNAGFFARLSHRAGEAIAPLAEPENLRPLEKVLLLLCLVLFLLASVFVGLFAGAQHKLSHSSPPWDSPWPSPTPNPPSDKPGHRDPPPTNSPSETCLTRDCVLTASDLLRGIDTSVDPCDDFYAFAVTGWLNSHPIPADAGLFGAGQYVAANNAKIVSDLLEAAPKKPNSKDYDERSLTKLKGFYDSCMQIEKQDDKDSDEPLLTLLGELGHVFQVRSKGKDGFAAAFEEGEEEDVIAEGQQVLRSPLPPNVPPGRSPRPHMPSDKPGPLPPAPGGFNSRQARLTRTLAWLHSRGVPALVEWTVDGDPGKDPQRGTPALLAGGLGLPDGEYYKDEAELEFYQSLVSDAFLAVRKALKEAAKDGHKGPVPSADFFKKAANRVVKFEQSLADITPDSADSDPISSYNPTNLTVLSYSMRSVDWPTYFAAMTVRPPKAVLLDDPKFVTRLDGLLSRTPDDVLAAYFFWSTIRTYGVHLPPSAKLRKPADQLDRHVKGVDPTAEEDRLTTCLATLNEALGFMAGRFFVQEAFGADAKAKAEGIIAGIIDAFKSRLPELDWLDDKTRSYAQEKADAVRIKVGYPDAYPNTTDAKAIFDFYSDLNVDENDYFANVFRSNLRLQRRQWSYVDRPLNPARWDMFTSEVNAYYNPGGNEIVFPAGVMQPPYFSPAWPDFMQFGAFGSTAGHELSHAFDPSGRLYDADGYLRDWWTRDTTAEFNRRKQCLLEQYGNYTISDGKGGQLPLNARLSIGEDVADGGGIEQSFRAWKTSYERGGAEASARNALLPGVDYTREQLFFIAYGQAWARNIRTTEAIRRLRTDEHSPTKYRVIGPLSNSKSFAAAFGCRAGIDRMARSDEDRCEIW